MAHCTMRYIQARWPLLDVIGRRLAMEIYTGPTNLAYLGRQLGLVEAMDPDSLFDSISKTAFRTQQAHRMHKPVADRAINSTRQQLKIQNLHRCAQKTNHEHGATLSALLGALVTSKPSERTHMLAWSFVNDVILGCVFDTRLLVKPLYPIRRLTEFLTEKGILDGRASEQLVFRLLRESGRLSHNSIYVVGVFASKESLILGQGLP